MAIKLRRFSELKNTVKEDKIESNQVSINDKDTPGEGLVHGEYNDFCFDYEVNGKKYQMRFDSSCYGDDEFDAIVHINDGIATLFKTDEFETLGKEFGFDDLEFLN